MEINEIKNGIWWVGDGKIRNGLRCNPYLLIENDTGVLFDPGSVLDFEQVYTNICRIIDPALIKYIVLSHQDPDLCSAVPLFEKKGLDFHICTHRRTKSLVNFYGIRSPYYIVNNHNFLLTLSEDRQLNFIMTPYLHFPGSIATYDSKTGTLFPGDLFGAVTADEPLFADADYTHKMISFHEEYMPAKNVLNAVMHLFAGMDIKCIAPQHGSVINKDISLYINALTDLDCGSFLIPFKEEPGDMGDFNKEYMQMLKEENLRLKEINRNLDEKAADTMQKLTHCPVTGLYNYDFFKSFLEEEINSIRPGSGRNPHLVIINIDNMAKIRFTHGDFEVDEVLSTTASIIGETLDEHDILFRLQGASFALYIPESQKKDTIAKSEKIRNLIAESPRYIEKITVSLGVASISEVPEGTNRRQKLYELAISRVRMAKERGRNIVMAESIQHNDVVKEGKVLLADTDTVSMEVLSAILKMQNYEVFTAKNGDEALEIIKNEMPDVVVSEIMLPKKDGFLLREAMLKDSGLKNIPFIIVSHLKNEDSVKRAVSLGMENYLKKPFMLTELQGIINLKIKGMSSDGI